MTVQVIGYRVHRSVCPCEGRQSMAVSFVGYDNLGGCRRAAVSRMSLVITCPQCSGAGELLAFLAKCEALVPVGPETGGGAA